MQQVYGAKDASMEEIAAKIGDIDRLPTYEEARRLFCFIERLHASDPKQLNWFGFCEKHKVHDIYNVEFVDALAEEIRGLNDYPIVEICAGDGKLSRHLRTRGIDIRATDNYSWEKIPRDGNLVERLSHREALERYLPRIVVASWIPIKGRIGFDVLGFPGVRYFVDNGETGWMTEGTIDIENWGITDLENVEKYSICRTDSTHGDFEDGIFHSGVRLFSRKGALH